MMKRLLSLAIVAAVSAAAYVIASKSDSESKDEPKDEAQLTNPVTVVSEKEFLDAGIRLRLPEDAVNAFWMTVRGIPLLYSLNFFIGETEYNLRIRRSTSLQNLSGMYFPWTAEETVSDGDTRAVIQTSSDEAGIALWYRDGCSISLSMKGAVTFEAMDEMFRFFNSSMELHLN